MSKKKVKSTSARKNTSEAGLKKDLQAQAKREAKKAVVLGTQPKSLFPLFVGIVFAVVIAAGAYYYFNRESNQYLVQNEQPAPGESDNKPLQVTFPVSMFKDGNALHFKYVHNDIAIKYFILKSSDGVVRAAFDACDVCWRAGKGYYQVEDFMVCRNCGRQFASVLVNEVKGGCNPAPLNRSIEGDHLVIRISDILEGKQFFDFSKRT